MKLLITLILQHKVFAGIIIAAVAAGGITTGVVVHNHNVKNESKVVANYETSESVEKPVIKDETKMVALEVSLKDDNTEFHTDTELTAELFTVIAVYSDNSKKELTEYTILPIELTVGENTISFSAEEKGNVIMTDLVVNVVDYTPIDNDSDYYEQYSEDVSQDLPSNTGLPEGFSYDEYGYLCYYGLHATSADPDVLYLEESPSGSKWYATSLAKWLKKYSPRGEDQHYYMTSSELLASGYPSIWADEFNQGTLESENFKLNQIQTDFNFIFSVGVWADDIYPGQTRCFPGNIYYVK